MEHPSGQQYVLRHADQVAVVTEVGAGVRSYRVGDVDVLDGFDVDAVCDGGRGQTLLPWPNRVADGRWSWAGKDYQLALTEPKRHNAIHGLTRWVNWELIDLTAQRARLRHRMHPQPGWPFPLRCEISYELSDAGLTVGTRLTNQGAVACPVAAGAHPYLSAGDATVDECTLHVPAASWIPIDERGLPQEPQPVNGTAYDFRVPRLIGDQLVDHAFSDLATATVTLHRPDGVVLALWAGPGYRYLQVYTGDTLAPDRRRRGVAVEPMTAPPNALQSGTDLVVLQPQETLTLQWRVSAVR